MVLALVAVCAVICTFFVSRMNSDHSLQQHAFNPMIGDLAAAKARLASPDAIQLPHVTAQSAAADEKVSRLHARLLDAAKSKIQSQNVARLSAAPTAAATPAVETPSAAVKPVAAKAASPDDDAIVAALKATLDKEEKDAELKQVTSSHHALPPLSNSPPPPPSHQEDARRKQAGPNPNP